ncbi:hypothetical protein [Mycobacterium sp. SMC-11]|uniref:hypothetical protein n=1 Tax=Mycobacterium sp. SMC-11 TaxID=3385969 RepID=UPI00390C4E15
MDDYLKLANVVSRFGDAVEALLTQEFRYPFAPLSDARLDCDADGEHRGTRSTQPLTKLAADQLRAVVVQGDLHHGIAAGLSAPKVFFAPYPVARTCVITAAKAWFIVGGGTRQERLQRYLNEELAGLYDAPLNRTDEEISEHIVARTGDLVEIGASAGLRIGRRRRPRPHDAPYLVGADQADEDQPAAETNIVRQLFAASGLSEHEARMPYKLLSAAAHGRLHYAGVRESIPTGRHVNGVPTILMHSSPRTSAKVTALAAIATRTHLRALARYVNAPEAAVQDRLGDPLAEWCAIGGVPLPE